jgi:predicted HTH domain antitoxin
MIEVIVQVPEGAFAALRQDPEHFSTEMKLAAAVKWYEMQMISQARAAEIAGLSRAEFMTALSRFGVSPFQETIEERSSWPKRWLRSR